MSSFLNTILFLEEQDKKYQQGLEEQAQAWVSKNISSRDDATRTLAYNCYLDGLKNSDTASEEYITTTVGNTWWSKHQLPTESREYLARIYSNLMGRDFYSLLKFDVATGNWQISPGYELLTWASFDEPDSNMIRPLFSKAQP